MKYEVRCCCQPQKLLGWIDGLPADAKTVVLSVDGEVQRLELPVATFAARIEISPELELMAAPEIVADLYEECRRQSGRAIKAEGVPIETLRRVRGFIENHDRSLNT